MARRPRVLLPDIPLHIIQRGTIGLHVFIQMKTMFFTLIHWPCLLNCIAVKFTHCA